MRRRIGWLAPAAAVAALAAGSTLVVNSVSGRSPAALGAATTTTTVPVEQVDFTDDREVEVTFDRVQPQPLTLSRGGVVTQTSCVAGRPLASGTAFLRVDEQVVFGWHQTIPLYRALRIGDRGRDVRALQQELVRLGHRLKVTDRFGPSTRTAMRRVERAAGVAKPDGVLDPAEVVWLPSAQVLPEACGLSVGQRAAPGAPIATLPQALVAVRPATQPVDSLQGARSARLFGQVTLVKPGVAITDPDFLKAVSASPEYRQGLEAKDADKPRATLSLATPVTAYKVPPGAVFGISGTQGCVEVGTKAVRVSVVGSGLGASLVTAGSRLTTVDVGDAITSSGCDGS